MAMRIIGLTIVCFSLLLTPSVAAATIKCGAGFEEVQTHTAFYTTEYAGRLAYAPLAKSTEDGKRAQFFCVFGSVDDYVIEKRSDKKLIFVLNNMRSSQEPQANAFLGVRFVRVGTPMVALETWKNESAIWEPGKGEGYNPYQDSNPVMRDKFLDELDRAENEAAFRKAVGINVFGTTRPGANGHSYSTWDRRKQLAKRLPSADDSINFTIIAFENRDSPPRLWRKADRDRRVTFGISPGNSTELDISTFGPPELSSIQARRYRITFK